MVSETGPVSTGLLKQVRICPEATWGVLPATGSASAQLLRRVASTVALHKATYRSNEIQPDRQVHDFRHGVRSVQGQIRGELSPLTYESVFAQVMAGSFTTGVTSTAATVTTVAAVPGNPGTAATISRATGSWQTDGFRIGDVIRFTGFTAGAAANNARNFRITAITTTTNPNDTLALGTAPNNSSGSPVEQQPNSTEVLVATAGATGVTATVVGKKLITPTPGNLVDASFAIEHYFQDVGQSEVYNGCRASRAQIQLPPTGLATIDLDIMGQNQQIFSGGSAPYFTAPQPITTSAITASVNGLMRVNGIDYAIVTGLNFTINANYTPEAVVGSNVTPYLFPGIQDITGQLSALFPDEQLPLAFLNESEIDMQVLLTLTSAINTDFISFYFPRIKLTSGNKDDKPGAIVGTYGFQALHNVKADGITTNTTDATTMVVQDSLAV